MSTVKLTCHNCGTEFEKTKSEVTRRRYKTNSEHWFCSRSCSATFGNKNRSVKKSPGPQYGNKHNQKWNPHLSWYMHRITTDRRLSCQLRESKQDMHDHLEQIWTGKCAVTGVAIKRRLWTGSVGTDNPFFIASLDRINNNLPYQKGNVRWTSLAVNLARQQTKDDRFDEHYSEFVASIFT